MQAALWDLLIECYQATNRGFFGAGSFTWIVFKQPIEVSSVQVALWICHMDSSQATNRGLFGSGSFMNLLHG